MKIKKIFYYYRSYCWRVKDYYYQYREYGYVCPIHKWQTRLKQKNWRRLFFPLVLNRHLMFEWFDWGKRIAIVRQAGSDGYRGDYIVLWER